MVRVLVLCEYSSLNGGERSLLTLTGGLIQAGYDMRLAGPAQGPLFEAAGQLEIPFAGLELHDASGCRLPIGACRSRIKKRLGAGRPDLVHANSLAMSRLSGPVCRQHGVPSIGHVRDIQRVNRSVISDLNTHRRLLTVSRATRDCYVADGLDADKTRVMYNGVDLLQFRPRHPQGWLHRELGLSSDAPLVGSVGQIGMRKGLDTLAGAAKYILREVPAAHFVVVGTRYSRKREAIEYEQGLQRMTSAMDLRGHFHFLGVRDDVHLLLNEFTLVAHAARQEPLGRVLLEASASGVPTVATEVGGTPEIFPAETHAAILVPPDDAQALAAAMTQVLTDRQLRQRMRWHARKRAEQAFDARTTAACLAEHYDQVLEGGV
jgi:glycosyltransferase involved in cell wall biosynthesis